MATGFSSACPTRLSASFETRPKVRGAAGVGGVCCLAEPRTPSRSGVGTATRCAGARPVGVTRSERSQWSSTPRACGCQAVEFEAPSSSTAPGDRFELYRGVAGIGARRRERGVSWTSSPDCASWFARRCGLAEPTLLRIQIDARHVLACLVGCEFGRREDEFLVLLPPRMRVAVHTRDRADIEVGAARGLTQGRPTTINAPQKEKAP